MDFGALRTFMPRGLYGRAALILIVPIVTIQIVMSILFIQRHFERVTEQMSQTMLREVAFVLSRIEAAPPQEAAAAAREVAAPLGLAVELPGGTAGPDTRRIYDLSGKVVISVLRGALPALRRVELADMDRVRLSLETSRGPVGVSFPRSSVSASNPHQLLVLMAAVSLLMMLIAYVFLRNQLRPIRNLSRAAEAFGRGESVPYRARGAAEVRAAGAAFVEMRARIERQIEQRTIMLSGISHDLRTPLTRMRLGLSLLPVEPGAEEEVAAIARDIDEMGRMIDAFLAFARDDAAEDLPERTDPMRFVAEVVEDARRAGLPVVLRPGAVAPDVRFRPAGLRRALENLIGNAVEYGARAEVSLEAGPRHLRIVVEDDGPGIAPADRDEALKPFVRLDPARNQDRGQGVGLGLAIAADIARSHGGALRLGESARLGGLRAELAIAR